MPTQTAVPMIHGDSPRTRRSDPITSHLAADTNDIKGSRRDVLDILQVFGPQADHEMVAMAAQYTPAFTPQRLRSARAELVELGLVEALGIYRLTASGRRANVWQVAARADAIRRAVA